MKMGLILSIGESFFDLKKHGQDELVRDQNVHSYSEQFKNVYVFSYADESYTFPKNCQLVSNKFKLNRFLYSLLMPILRYKEFKDCDVLRGFQITGGIPCVIAKIFLKKPFVVNYGYDYQKVALIEGHPIRATLYMIINRLVLSTANFVIVTNKTFIKTVKRAGAKNIIVIPNSVNIQQFRPKEKRNNKFVKEILFVGRLEPQKNLFNLLEAVKSLKHEYHLQIIGMGSQKKELQRYVLKNKISAKFIDAVSHNRLPVIMRSADIFVLPSLVEGHPKALIEAMATGLPCVATNAEGIKEILENGKTGILVETDSKSIKEGLEKLISNPTLSQKIGKNARSYVVSHFDASNLMKKEIKLLRSQVR